MALFAMFQRSRLGKFIMFLVFLVIILQVFHMSLLTRLEAKEALGRQKVPVGRHLKEKLFSTVVDEIEEKVRNSHRLDYSGTYHIIADILPAESAGSFQRTDDVSVVTQCTSNHLHYLTHLLQRWDGLISVAVFTFDKDMETALQNIVQLRLCNEIVRKKVSFHLVYPLNRAPSSLSDKWKSAKSCDETIVSYKNSDGNYAIDGIAYPHNLLRNLAIKYSTTPFVFMFDVDMIPSVNLYRDFLSMRKSILKTRQNATESETTVFIVPAFEVQKDVTVPDTKVDLLREWSQGRVRPFYSTVCWKCQKHTDYEKWRGLEQTVDLHVAYQVVWKDPWEPFFIGRKRMPLYDERFKQYGFNRISQVCELQFAGYDFAVLNNAFLVHKGFKEAGKFHSTKEQEMVRNVQLFRKFKEELKVKYPNSTRRC